MQERLPYFTDHKTHFKSFFFKIDRVLCKPVRLMYGPGSVPLPLEYIIEFCCVMSFAR